MSLPSAPSLVPLKLGNPCPVVAENRGVRRCARSLGDRQEAVPHLVRSAGTSGPGEGRGEQRESWQWGGCSGARPHRPQPLCAPLPTPRSGASCEEFESGSGVVFTPGHQQMLRTRPFPPHLESWLLHIHQQHPWLAQPSGLFSTTQQMTPRRSPPGLLTRADRQPHTSVLNINGRLREQAVWVRR